MSGVIQILSTGSPSLASINLSVVSHTTVSAVAIFYGLAPNSITSAGQCGSLNFQSALQGTANALFTVYSYVISSGYISLTTEFVMTGLSSDPTATLFDEMITSNGTFSTSNVGDITFNYYYSGGTATWEWQNAAPFYQAANGNYLAVFA